MHLSERIPFIKWCISVLRYTVLLYNINYRSGKNVRVNVNTPEQWKEYTAVRMQWYAQKPNFIFHEMVSPSTSVGVTVQSTAGSWGVCLCVSASGVWTMLDRLYSAVMCAYLTPTPFSSFPFTSPSMCHCVPSYTNWPLHMNMFPEMLFFWFAALLFLKTVVLTIFQHEWHSVRWLCSVVHITSFILFMYFLLFVCLFKVVFKCRCVNTN